MASAWFESIEVAQRRAKRRLPKSVYMALIAGAERGVTLADNTAAFGELRLRPVTAGQSPTREMNTVVMAQAVSMPVLTQSSQLMPDMLPGPLPSAACHVTSLIGIIW